MLVGELSVLIVLKNNMPTQQEEIEIIKIAEQIQSEYQMGGLADGIYLDFVKEVAIRYDNLRRGTAISLAVAQREKEIVEMIEEKKLKEPLYIGETQYRFYKGNVDWVYNSALNDIINTLKGGKE